MTTLSLPDLRYYYYGGGSQAEMDFMQQAYNSGISAVDVLSGGGGGTSVATKDEGTTIAAVTNTINFTGAGVTTTLGAAGVANVDIPGGSGSPSGVAGGSLSGTYPNPTLAANSVTSSQITDGQVTSNELANNAITTPKITDACVTTAKLGVTTAPTIKGRITAGLGAQEDLSPTQVTSMLDLYSASAKGLVPVSPGNSTDYLCADATWKTLPDLQSGVGVNTNTSTPNVVKFDLAEEINPQTLRLDSGVKLMAARLATTANLSCTYNNGVGGVGATLTASANGALTLDTVATANNNVVLVRNQTNLFENGVYTVTDAGSAGTPFILTRSIYAQADVQWAVGIVVLVTDGDKWLGSVWRSYPLTVTPGTTSIVWRPFNSNSDATPVDVLYGSTRLHRRWQDDFEALSSVAVTAPGPLPSLGAPIYLWMIAGSTAAQAVQNGSADITNGSCKIDTGTLATGGAAVTFTNLGQAFDGTIPYAFGARLKIGTVTTAGVQAFHTRLGIIQGIDTGVVTNGAFFHLPDDGSTIKCIVMDNSVATTVDTTVAQGTGQHVYGVSYDEVTKQFEFTYDSSFRTLIAAPANFTNWNGVMAGVGIVKTVGTTTRDVRVDYMNCRIKETRPNWLYLPA